MSASPEHGERGYRATLVDQRGMVVSTVRIVAADDAEACEKAIVLVGDHDVDLWEDLRFVEHFPAIDPPE
mgnify:CR=1 FL=1